LRKNSFILKILTICICLTIQSGFIDFISTIRVQGSPETRLSLEPEMIVVPFLGLEEASQHIEITLRIENVEKLKEYNVEFYYDPEILEWYNGKINTSFYLAVGGMTGSVLHHRYSGSYSGSIDAYTYCFRILKPGFTTIRLVNTELRDALGDIIPHTTSGCNVTILSVSEWINGEYENLQIKYDAILEEYSDLNSNYMNVTKNYNILLSNYENIESEYNLLLLKYQDLYSNYSLMQSEYENLESECDALKLVNQNLESHQLEILQLIDGVKEEIITYKNITYVLIVIVIILIAIIIYSRTRK